MTTEVRNFPGCKLFVAVIPVVLLAACGDNDAQPQNADETKPAAAEEAHAGVREVAHGEVHWGYEDDNGPAVWASMKPEWALCGEGRHQSPVDLNNPVESELPAIAVHTLSQQAVEVLNQNEVLEELDNGHTVQVNALLPDALQIDGKSYSLKQFHFHSPSEHTVDGEHFPMEIHFVNEAADGSLAVLGVLVSEGAENPAIASLWASLPQAHGESTRTELPVSFAENLLTGVGNGFFHYSGSLTTPPCTEDVKWMIKRSPTELSAAQIQAFRAIYDHNNRPTNPLHDRELFVDSSPSIRWYD
jgi:carbonic anhydrase